jgi:oligopeptidase B
MSGIQASTNPMPAPAVGRTAPPRAPARPTSTVWHGVVLTDEFAWLRDPNWQAVMRDPSLLDPAIRAHLEGENGYADAMLAATLPLQETLFAEMKARIKEDDSSVPAADGPYSYFMRYRNGGQHPMVCREHRDGSGTQIMLDGDALADGRSFFRLGATTHSPDHALLAWSADETGAELYTVRVRDLFHFG